MRLVFFSLLLILFFLGCSFTPITTNISDELALGKKMSKRILRRAKLSKNKKAIDMVNSIGKKIIEVVEKDYNRTNYDWKFRVIEDKFRASAICLPNGNVFVYSGLFPYIDNENELAIVLGHEIAHALARHKFEKNRHSTLSNFTTNLIQLWIISDKNKLQVQKEIEVKRVEEMMKEWIVLPHSRTQEYEADHIGLVLCAKAGYNPKSAINFWSKFPQKSRIRPEYASTHPTPIHRIKKMKEIISTIL